jgi:hypothetical protein
LPRYHFVVTWQDRVREYGNTEGTILQDEEEARRFAARIIRELKQAGEHDDPELYMVVKDAEGREVFTLSFRTILSHLLSPTPFRSHACACSVWSVEVECQRIWAAMLSFLLFYLPLAGGGEEPVAAGISVMARANASIAIFQVPFSPFSILNQLPWMVLSLTVTE